MALQTTLQYTESNLVGTITEGTTTTTTTIRCRFYDNVTGEPRTPLATTKLFVIDKGSASQPSSNYEIVLAGSHSTTDGVTTLTTCVRGLSFSGVSLTGGTGKLHTGGAEIGTVDLHYLTSCLVATIKGVGDQPRLKVYAALADRNSDVASPLQGDYCYVQDVERLYVYNGSAWTVPPQYVFASTTARDAEITVPELGMIAYIVADGVFTGYGASGWADFANGATPNASTTVAGKTQQATDVQAAASTVTGSTGAPLFVNPGTLSITGAANKVPIATGTRLDRSWLYDTPYITLVAGENIAAGKPVYIKIADSAAWLASSATVETATVVGFSTNTVTTGQTVYVQTAGEVTGLSGISANTVYLGSTPGTYTTTQPVMNDGSVVPVILGQGITITSLILRPVRLQRVKQFSQTIANTDASYTLSCGFIPGTATVTSLDFFYNSTAQAFITGFVDIASNAQNNFGGNGIVSSFFLTYWGASNNGSNVTSFTAGRSGTDFVLTRTSSSITSSKSSMIIVYENI